MVVHCFFEQSGTFKNEFKKLGIAAYDYDIRNDFGQTDFMMDLFCEIDKAYDGNDSCFDNITKDDLIFAFFPCIRFEEQILMHFKGVSFGLSDWSVERRLEYDLKLHSELSFLYAMVTKLVLVCFKKDIPLIIENPYSKRHYLNNYWCLNPSVIDCNRRVFGDFYRKPTQFWFVNIVPKNNLIMDEPIVINPKKTVVHSNTVERSIISSDYARNFIRTFILEV